MNRKKVTLNILWLIYLIVWIGGAIYLYRDYKAYERQIEQRQQIRQRQEEVLRRQAAYQQRMLQEEAIRSGVQNAIDGVKK